MPKIFISYRQSDNAYATGWLNERLRSRFGNDSVSPGMARWIGPMRRNRSGRSGHNDRALPD